MRLSESNRLRVAAWRLTPPARVAVAPSAVARLVRTLQVRKHLGAGEVLAVLRDLQERTATDEGLLEVRLFGLV